MSHLGITETHIGSGDQSWQHDPTRLLKKGGTLDLALFVPTPDTIAHGSVRSGVAVAKVEATGLYGPYDPEALDGRDLFAGYVFDDVPTRGKTAGNFGFSIVIGGVIRTDKLPLADSAPGTPGQVDDAAITTWTGLTSLVHTDLPGIGGS